MVLIAPATADFIARLVGSEANDLLTTICLATSAPIAVAPAMNQGMGKNTLTQENLQAVHSKKAHVFSPAEGQAAAEKNG
jgi:phosphopantothenoylcysteine decarboxylase/phosphopantothenate--cysteine ligase